MHPIDPAVIHGEAFAVVMINTENGGEDDAIVLFGRASWNGESLSVEREDHPPFPVPDHTWDRIQLVASDLESILQPAKYWVTLYVVPKPEDAKPGEFVATGVTWPAL